MSQSKSSKILYAVICGLVVLAIALWFSWSLGDPPQTGKSGASTIRAPEETDGFGLMDSGTVEAVIADMDKRCGVVKTAMEVPIGDFSMSLSELKALKSSEPLTFSLIAYNLLFERFGTLNTLDAPLFDNPLHPDYFHRLENALKLKTEGQKEFIRIVSAGLNCIRLVFTNPAEQPAQTDAVLREKFLRIFYGRAALEFDEILALISYYENRCKKGKPSLSSKFNTILGRERRRSDYLDRLSEMISADGNIKFDREFSVLDFHILSRILLVNFKLIFESEDGLNVAWHNLLAGLFREQTDSSSLPSSVIYSGSTSIRSFPASGSTTTTHETQPLRILNPGGDFQEAEDAGFVAVDSALLDSSDLTAESNRYLVTLKSLTIGDLTNADRSTYIIYVENETTFKFIPVPTGGVVELN